MNDMKIMNLAAYLKILDQLYLWANLRAHLSILCEELLLRVSVGELGGTIHFRCCSKTKMKRLKRPLDDRFVDSLKIAICMYLRCLERFK